VKPPKSNQADDRSITTPAAISVFVAFLAVASIELLGIASRADTTPDLVFCSPSALHTTIEPPETQLTRDNAAIRVLLRDAGDHFTQVRKIYAGEIHVAVPTNAGSALLQRGSHSGLFKPDYQRNPWNGSLRQEAQRLDFEHGTTLAVSVDKGIQTGDREGVEAALRAMFAGLLDDLLLSIEQKLSSSVNVERALQHARRYYSEGLDAYLSINTPAQASRASYSLDAMVKAAEDIKADKSGAKDWFSHERTNFMNAIHEALGARAERPQRL
jgi:hypothetical protein